MCDSKPPTPDFSGSGPVEYAPSDDQTSHSDIEAALANHSAHLLSIRGVTSVGIGLGEAGATAIVVGVTDAGVQQSLPDRIDGFPVVVTVTGEVDALPRR